jgi:hypothetical protein
MNAVGQPRFLLFDDGELIVLNGNYERTRVTEAESIALIDSIASTELFERSPIAIPDRWGEITVRGEKYFLAQITSSTDLDQSLDWQVVSVLQNFRPDGLSRFFPDRLHLEIYDFSTEEELVSVLPFAMDVNGDWESSPLNKFGAGETAISNSDMELVKKEFTGFPQLHLYSNHAGYILAMVCADFEQLGQ